MNKDEGRDGNREEERVWNSEEGRDGNREEGRVGNSEKGRDEIEGSGMVMSERKFRRIIPLMICVKERLICVKYVEKYNEKQN